MTIHHKKAETLAKEDHLFTRIFAAKVPVATLTALESAEWLDLTSEMTSYEWVMAAIDCKSGIFKTPDSYSPNTESQKEISLIQDHYRRFNHYAAIIAGLGENPFTDYLNGITVNEFIDCMRNLRGMDAAREVQYLFQEGKIDHDLGGSQLHRYMEDLSLPYIPTINHLNAARRGEDPQANYDMTKSRKRNEKYNK